MKQKIIIKLLVPCDKCSSKALALAAAADGVMSVALEGQDREQVVMVGDGVDAACLTSSLKKVGRVHLVSVEEVKEKAVKKDKEGKQNGGEKGKNGGAGDKENGGDAKKNVGENKNIPPPCVWTIPHSHQPQLEFYNIMYDSYPPSCTVM